MEYWPSVLKSVEAGFHFAQARTIQLEVHPEESLSGPKDWPVYGWRAARAGVS